MHDEQSYERQIRTLKQGLETRGRIGMALGITMERFGLTEERAWDVLQRLSQHQNVKLHQVAEDVISGEALGQENIA